jgi:BirA family biotin operon repressor/biotin-[acetyl-CoA-carboxylase] ligase
MKYMLLEEVDSTNSYVAVHAAELEDMTMVIANTQTAGRGQRGNSWESDPGCNLTFTLFCRPKGVAPAEQFAISEASALAVADTLAGYGVEARVKWPNDVYVDDRKISGILIEHSLQGGNIEHTRIGIGLNVNQPEFHSDAPNPVSIRMIIGHDSDLGQCATRMYNALATRLEQAYSADSRKALHREFIEKLWRGDGEFYPFRDRESSARFMGRILNVEPTGFIHIESQDDQKEHIYAFKEIEFLLK